MIERYLKKQVKEDLKEKMVFIGGPRQVGKTTLAQNIVLASDSMYLNWDSDKDRRKILNQEFEEKKLWKREILLIFSVQKLIAKEKGWMD